MVLERLDIRIPPELRKALEKEAKAERRTLSDYLRLALADHIASKRKKRRRGR